ncbi:hypothetical protein [Halobacillus sp. B29]|uniref:hypothetical protein n=1 Tax=Halobacillus sp. B29 TaxID=3457432 RepID=UPI003FCCE498
MNYFKVPREINSKNINKNDACFSPSKYRQFVVPNKDTSKVKYENLNKLVVLREETFKIHKTELYKYAEIGDIDVNTGGIVFRNVRGNELSSSNLKVAKKEDILMSTVRTYRKGIGMVSSSSENQVTTNALINICDTTNYFPEITKRYIYSFLRSSFFIDQVWSMINRGVYPRMDKGALDKIIVPIPADKKIIEYISKLTKAIVEKEEQIRAKHKQMINKIESELENNQGSGNKYIHSYPTNNDIITSRRMDASFWSEKLKRKIHFIKSYKYGCWESIYQAGYFTRRGQNLQVSNVGQGYYYDHPVGNSYALVYPSDINDYMSISKFSYYGNKRKLNYVRKGEVIFAAKGKRDVSIGHSYVNLMNRKFLTNIDAFLIDSGDIEMNIFLGQCFSYYKQIGLFSNLSDASNGGSFVENYFNYLPIPKFPSDKVKEITNLYHNPSPEMSEQEDVNLNNFVVWHRRRNKELGVWDLDMDLKTLQSELDKVQNQLVKGEDINIPGENLVYK